MPASASPLPPLASAGEPTAFSAHCCPSAVSITVTADLSTTLQPYFARSASAAPSLSDSTAGISQPSSRAASPACGVITARAPSCCGCPASRFSAPASHTW